MSSQLSHFQLELLPHQCKQHVVMGSCVIYKSDRLENAYYVIIGHLTSVRYHEIEDIQIAAFVLLILGRLLHAIDLT